METATTSTAEVLAAFARTTEQTYSPDELRALLDAGRQLRIKYGVDVTAPYLHIGHAVNLWMMRRLQDLGHRVLFLIGDFTTRIGDPTGRNKARPVIPPEEIEANAQQFIAQARMVLRFDDPNLLEIRRNSEWYDAMPASELLRLLALVTHGRLIARDMFQARIAAGHDIHMHELVYPVLQGYDSWALRSDLTIIGTDQLYNEMLGRFMQERLGQPPQVIITTKITPGLDGKAKQSKSLGNYVGLGHSPRDKYGRLMSLPDALIPDYLRVYTELPLERVAGVAARLADAPLACKHAMAHAIVARYHGAAVADAERDWFIATFSRHEAPADMPELWLAAGEPLPAIELVSQQSGATGATRSKSALRRLFAQRAVVCDGRTLTDPDELAIPRDGMVFQVGKRAWFRVRIERK